MSAPKWARLALALVTLAAGPSLASAAERALLIGIDSYARKRPLRGAVSDARDLAAALAKRGVADVRLLLNESADHASVMRAWESIARASQSGDTIIITFAGHGTKETSEASAGSAKGFLLQPYDERAAPEEIIRDDELYDLFRPLSEKGVTVLFIADSCHAGGAIRGPADQRAAGTAVRFQTYETLPASKGSPPSEGSQEALSRPPLRGVAVFSATDEHHTISEAVIGGRPRGALSWAVARAIESDSADVTRDGVISAGELQNFVAPLVRSLPERQQIPQFRFLDSGLGLLRVGSGRRPDADARPAPKTAEDVGLAVIGGGLQDLQIAGAELVTDPARAELIWDAERRQLLNGIGDVIASDIDRLNLSEAVGSRQVLRDLIALSTKAPALEVGLSLVGRPATPDGGMGYFVKGDTVEFALDRSDRPYVTIFDLNADGTVHFLWPLAEWGDAGKVSGPIRFRAPVAPPYGFDTVIFLASDIALTGLHAELRSMDGRPEPLRLRAALRSASEASALSIGMQSQFTCGRLMENQQCDTMLSSLP